VTAIQNHIFENTGCAKTLKWIKWESNHSL